MENCRDSAHRYNYQDKYLKGPILSHLISNLGNFNYKYLKSRVLKVHTVFVFQNVSKLGRIWDLWNFKLFHISSPILKLPVNFHHQYFATGTDMAKMHWFILEGGMFTEIKPDSIKAKHMLQHENPTPSSKTPLVVSIFSSCLFNSSLNFSLSFFVYTIIDFSFDNSNFKRLKKFFLLTTNLTQQSLNQLL